MDKYEKLGGEEAIARTAAEALQEEEARLFRPKFSLKHLTLMTSIPGNPFYDNHDPFGDNLILGFGTDPDGPDDEPSSSALAA